MGGSADEIDRAGAQCRVALIDGVDQLERDIEAFPLEKAELDRGNGGEIRVRDHVGHGKFHRHSPAITLERLLPLLVTRELEPRGRSLS